MNSVVWNHSLLQAVWWCGWLGLRLSTRRSQVWLSVEAFLRGLCFISSCLSGFLVQNLHVRLTIDFKLLWEVKDCPVHVCVARGGTGDPFRMYWQLEAPWTINRDKQVQKVEWWMDHLGCCIIFPLRSQLCFQLFFSFSCSVCVNVCKCCREVWAFCEWTDLQECSLTSNLV